MNIAKLKKELNRLIPQIPKKIRFVMGASVLSGLYFLLTTFGFAVVPYVLLPYLGLVYFVVWFCVYEKIEKIEWVTLFSTTIFLSAAWLLFFYLIPIRFISRISTTLIFMFATYISIAVANVLNVSVDRNLQLYKVAITFNKIIQLIVIYVFAQIAQAFELNFALLLVFSFAVCYINALQFYWSCDTKLVIDKRMGGLALITATICAFAFTLTSFIPFINIGARSILVGGIYYIFTSIFELYFESNPNLRKISSYIYLLLVLLVIFILTVVW